jgi:uncharacterized membrane protein
MNYWTFTPTLSYTYFDMKRGLDLSVVAGIDFNTRNPDTDYTSGALAHVDASLMQYLSKNFAIGMVRQWLIELTEFVVPVVDLLALLMIAGGTLAAFINAIRVAIAHSGDHHAARVVWMQYARWLIAGLTFQLAADIIETSVAPSWNDIGQLAAIAVIRTFLNFFLERDQRDVRELQRETEQREPELAG